MRIVNGFTMSSGILAAAAFAALAGHIPPAVAAASSGSYSTSTSTTWSVESTGPTQDSEEYMLVENNGSYTEYGVMDVNAANLLNAGGNSIPAGTNLSSITGLNLAFDTNTATWQAAGPINVYLSTLTSASTLSNAVPNASGAYGDVGTTFGKTSNNTLFSLGTVSYSNTVGTVNTLSVSSPSSALSTYLANDINNAGDIRLLFTPGNNTVAAEITGADGYTSHNPPLYAPELTVTGTTVTAPPSDGILSLNNSSVSFNRIVNSTPATATLTLTNTSASGADSVNYIVVGQAANNSGNAPGGVGTGLAGTNPLGPNASTPITVGFNASGIEAGTLNSVTGPSTATVNILNRSNANQSTPLTVTLTANQVVANRLINNAGGSAGVNFGDILIPNSPTTVNSVTQNVTLTTTNTIGSTASNVVDYTPNSLTTVELAGSTAIAGPTGSGAAPGLLKDAPTGDTSYITMAADPNNANTIFGSTTNAGDSGTETATRSVSYYVPGTETIGGAYTTAKYYIGYASFGLTQLDSALGATQNPTGRVYVIGNIYQQAQLQDAQSTANNGAGTFYAQLQNAPHTANYQGGKDIGLRDAAVITAAPTGIDAANTQYASAWTLDSALAANTVIGDGQSVNAADFTPGATLQPTLLNGQYQVQINSITAQNDATGLDGNAVAGASANDLGTNNYVLTASVTGNVGHAGTANSAAILAGESYNGYNIQRANETGSQQTNVQFLGGTASVATTLSVDFANAPTANNSVVSDVANITGTGSDTHVVQMSYNPSSISNGSNSPTLAWYNGSIYQAANFGDTGGTPTEYTGAYNPATAGENALGSYGINTANDTVWAVVNNGTGNFAVMQRIAGDTTGKGSVTTGDLATVYNNVGIVSGATWSQGDFVGTGNVSTGDLATVYNNVGITESAISAGTVKAAPRMSVMSSPAASAPAVTDVSLTVNRTTGDAILVFNNPNSQFYAWEITSTTGGLMYANLTDVTGFGTGRSAKGADALDGVYSGFANGGYYNPGGTWNLGDIITPADITSNSLDFQFSEFDPTNNGYAVNFDPATINYTSVPEPATLALVALGGLVMMGGLSIRRRINV
ncbi:MAG: PEP-CTERM sorting domain-containing protein [Phycisphaerae bacterium]